jgi:hypothetical protein
MQLWAVRRWLTVRRGLIGAKSGESTCGTDSPLHALAVASLGDLDRSAEVLRLDAIMRGRDYV